MVCFLQQGKACDSLLRDILLASDSFDWSADDYAVYPYFQFSGLLGIDDRRQQPHDDDNLNRSVPSNLGDSVVFELQQSAPR